MTTMEDIRAMKHKLDTHPAIWVANGMYKVDWDPNLLGDAGEGTSYEASRLIYSYNKMRSDYVRGK